MTGADKECEFRITVGPFFALCAAAPGLLAVAGGARMAARPAIAPQ